jgi:hypothetical protein
MRLATLILGLAALLLAGATAGPALAQSGGCDPAACAGAKSGGCAKAATTTAAANATAAKLDPSVPAPDGEVYGHGVSAGSTLPVSTVLADPEQYLGKTVRVAGPVIDVCKSRGCWIEIASDEEQQKIQLKVDDGVIVFPPEIMGETAVVEGTLEGIPMTHEQACEYLAHEAECQGESFDASTVPAEGITLYRIKGTGAVVVASAH